MPPCGDEQCYARDWLREAPKLRSNAVARTGRLPIYLLHTTQDAILLVVTGYFWRGLGQRCEAPRDCCGLMTNLSRCRGGLRSPRRVQGRGFQAFLIPE